MASIRHKILQNPIVSAAWTRRHMRTFSVLLVFCEGNSPVPDEFPSQRPVTRNFDVVFDLRLNRDAGDLRRQRAHYDVTVTIWTISNLSVFHLKRKMLSSMFISVVVLLSFYRLILCLPIQSSVLIHRHRHTYTITRVRMK